MVTAGQAGYGLGLLFFLPLGDIVDRNRMVLSLTWLGAAVLALTAVVPTLGLLILASLLVGDVSMSAQILVPFAVDLSPPERRSRIVGVLMTGLLGGVLLVRSLSGFVGDYFGWRSMFGLAAAMMVSLALLLRGRLPHRQPAAQMS